jgi:hypothetical protein
MIESLTLNCVEHPDGVHVYVWRLSQEGRFKNRRQVAVLWLAGASVKGSPSRLTEALWRELAGQAWLATRAREAGPGALEGGGGEPQVRLDLPR